MILLAVVLLAGFFWRASLQSNRRAVVMSGANEYDSSMAILIGTDEAGYGPNLGPLIVAASMWRVPDGKSRGGDDLYDRLSGVIAATTGQGAKLLVADSKQLYQSGDGLDALERGLFPLLSLDEPWPSTWRDVWRRLAPQGPWPWESSDDAIDFDCATPRDFPANDIATLAEDARDGLKAAGVELLAVRASPVFPAEFNDLVEQYGSKGELLSRRTLTLVRDLLGESPGEPVRICCDKHGGRNRYSPLLQQLWPDPLIEVRDESRETSRYAWGARGSRVEIEFRAKGERFLPTALASMAAKYLRELAMEAINAFWQARQPDLKPTAGYPVDARRFYQETAATRTELGLSDRRLWRMK